MLVPVLKLELVIKIARSEADFIRLFYLCVLCWDLQHRDKFRIDCSIGRGVWKDYIPVLVPVIVP
jgi:hypothetical protein